MTDQVHASATDIRRLAAALKAYDQQVRQASRQVRGALNSANWHDQRKEQFEGRYRDLQKQVDGFLAGEVADMVKGLSQLATKLDDVGSTRL